MFGVFCLAAGVFIFFCAKETKGRTLEEMDVLFGAVDEEHRKAAVEHVMNKGVATHIEQAEDAPGEHNKA